MTQEKSHAKEVLTKVSGTNTGTDAVSGAG